MTIHSSYKWEFGDPITEEFISEIIRVIKSNVRVMAFAMCSRVDEFAYIFMENVKFEDLKFPDKYAKQIKEIYELVDKKLKENL